MGAELDDAELILGSFVWRFSDGEEPNGWLYDLDGKGLHDHDLDVAA
jgi:hypothetical protein